MLSLPLVALVGVPLVSVGLAWLIARRWRLGEHMAALAVSLVALLAPVAMLVLGWPPYWGLDLAGGTAVVYSIAPGDQAVDSSSLAAAVVRRINPGGTSDVQVDRLGADRLRVLLPRLSGGALARRIDLIARPGTVEFRILANDHDHLELVTQANKEPEKLPAARQAWWVPVSPAAEKEVLAYKEIAKWRQGTGAGARLFVLVVGDEYDITGRDVVRAWPGVATDGSHYVNYALSGSGSQRMARLTGTHLPDEVQKFNRRLAAIVDGELVSASAIETAIRNEGQITVRLTQEQAEDMAAVLTAGSLPVALGRRPMEQFAVGPQVSGRFGLWGGAAVGVICLGAMAALVVRQRTVGLLVGMGVLLSALWLAALLVVIRLPVGLAVAAAAAVALLIAVDVHGLVLSRMREESLERRALFRNAVRNGMARAVPGAVDAMVVLAALSTLLFLLGSGKVKAFAVPLWIVVPVALSAALLIVRWLLEMADRIRPGIRFTELEAAPPAPAAARPRWWLWPAVALAILIGGIAAAALRGPALFDAATGGGQMLEIGAEGPLSTAALRRAAPLLADATIRASGDTANGSGGDRFLVDVPYSGGLRAADFSERLEIELAAAGVPARVEASGALARPAFDAGQQRTIVALMLAAAAVVGYLWWRFGKAYYGVAALTATLVDALAVASLAAMAQAVIGGLGLRAAQPWRWGAAEFSALLAVAAFSLYDKVIVFDRLRDARGKSPGLSWSTAVAAWSYLRRRISLVWALALTASTLVLVGAGRETRLYAFIFLIGTPLAMWGSMRVAVPMAIWLSQSAAQKK